MVTQAFSHSLSDVAMSIAMIMFTALVIDKWCHNQNLGLEDFLWEVAKYSEEL